MGAYPITPGVSPVKDFSTSNRPKSRGRGKEEGSEELPTASSSLENNRAFVSVVISSTLGNLQENVVGYQFLDRCSVRVHLAPVFLPWHISMVDHLLPLWC